MPFLAVLAAWAQPARADITADYYLWGPIGPSMRVEVADNGDARVQMAGGETVAIRRDGLLYVVRRDELGSFVLRWDDFHRIQARKDRELGGLPELAEMPPVAIVESGVETVGGREGIVLQLVSGEESSADSRFAFVVNRDPDLAPVGSMVAHVFGWPAIGSPLSLAGVIEDIHARGTLIRMAFMLRLEGTSDALIPPSAFELPGPVLSGEEAEARLGPAW